MEPRTEAGGYLYLVHLREFLRLAEPVYTVGKTKCLIDRMRSYPKGSVMLCAWAVSDRHVAEAALLAALRKAFVPRTDIDTETFEGDLFRMETLATVLACAFPVALEGSGEHGRVIGREEDGDGETVGLVQAVVDEETVGLVQAALRSDDMDVPEHRFLKALVQAALRPDGGALDGGVRYRLDALFDEFQAWLRGQGRVGERGAASASAKSFGRKFSKLVWSDDNVGGFRGITKTRGAAGMTYAFDVLVVADEMVVKRWVSADEFDGRSG